MEEQREVLDLLDSQTCALTPAGLRGTFNNGTMLPHQVFFVVVVPRGGFLQKREQWDNNGGTRNCHV